MCHGRKPETDMVALLREVPETNYLQNEQRSTNDN